MSERDLIAEDSSNFFGKGSLTPFIGVVEDVNDPKHSNRVKVRCVGWHPETKQGKDGVKTDDLPWATCGMPVTMAQQGRVGGTHGLQPGSWVFGFFLDGDEANDPFICNTFNFTSKASEVFNRQISNSDGKQEESVPGFTKVVDNENSPNAGGTTVGETGQQGGAPTDPAKDNVNEDANDPCTGRPSNKSYQNARAMDESKKNGNPAAQKYKVGVADGLCGSTMKARDDIQKKLEEQFPSQLSRFIYGDAVWNRFTGNFMDLNGILAQLALFICNTMKQPINAGKAMKEDINRGVMSKGIQANPLGRDALVRMTTTMALSKKDDFFHGLLQTGFIDILCSIIMSLLQGLNDGNEESEDGDNNTGNVGANPNTPIKNNRAYCITDTLLRDIDILTNQAFEEADEAAQKAAESDNTEILGVVASLLGVLLGGMGFPLIQKYSTHPKSLNAAGTLSQDVLTKTIGCLPIREYDTALGSLGSIAGGGGGGGSSSQGSSTDGGTNSAGQGVPKYATVGFGGLPGENKETSVSTIVCEEAYTQPIPAPSQGSPGAGLAQDIVDNQIITEGIPTNKIPTGDKGSAISVSQPSENIVCARNFIKGTPNGTVIIEPGENYYFESDIPENTFPSIYIPGYAAKPVPVVDKNTGEMVAILTNCGAFDPNQPNAPITIIPDDSDIGIDTEDPDYDIVLGGFYIQNTGFSYCNPKIGIFDKDTLRPNGEVTLVTQDGRIVDYDIINSGTNFKRIPRVVITDDGRECGTQGGFGAKLFPIMNVVARPNAKEPPAVVDMVFCPAKNQVNALQPATTDEVMAASRAIYATYT